MFTVPIPNYEDKIQEMSQDLSKSYISGMIEVLQHIQEQIDHRELYILFEDELNCDPATDHEVPKSVLPIFRQFFNGAEKQIKSEIFINIKLQLQDFMNKIIKEQTDRANNQELEKFQIGADLESEKQINSLHEKNLQRLENTIAKLTKILAQTSGFLKEQKYQQNTIGDMYQGDNQEKTQKTLQEFEKIPNNNLSKQLQELQQRYIQSQNQLENLKQQAGMVNTQVQMMSELNDKNQDLENQLNIERMDAQKLKQTIGEKESVIDQQSDQYLKLVSEFNDIHEKYDQLILLQNNKKQEELEDIKIEIENDIREGQAQEFSKLNQQISDLSKQKQQLSEQLDDYKSQIQISDQNFIKTQEQLEIFTQKYMNSSENATKFQDLFEDEKKQKQKLQKQLEDFKIKVVDLNQQSSSNVVNSKQLKEYELILKEQEGQTQLLQDQVIDKDREIKRLKAQLQKNMARISEERSQSGQCYDSSFSRPGSGMFQKVKKEQSDKEVQTLSDYIATHMVNQSSPDFHRGFSSVNESYNEENKKSFDERSSVLSGLPPKLSSKNNSFQKSKQNMPKKPLSKQSTRPEVELLDGISQEDEKIVQDSNSPSVNQLEKLPKGSAKKIKDLNSMIQKVQVRYGHSPQQQIVDFSPNRLIADKEQQQLVDQLTQELAQKDEVCSKQLEELGLQKQEIEQLKLKISQLEDHIKRFAEDYIPVQHVIKDERVSSYVTDTSNVDAEHKYNVNYYERQLDALKVAQQTVFNFQNNLNSPPHIKKDLQERVSKIKQNMNSLEKQINQNTDLSIIDDINGEAPDQVMTDMMQLNKQKNSLTLTKNTITSSIIKAATKNSVLDIPKQDKSNADDLNNIVTTHEKLYSMASLIRSKIEILKQSHRDSREKIYNRYLESMRLLSKEQMQKLEDERNSLKQNQNDLTNSKLSLNQLSTTSNANFAETGTINISIVDLQPTSLDDLQFTYHPEKVKSALIFTRNEDLEEAYLPSLQVTRNCSGERKVLTKVSLFESQVERKSNLRKSGFDYLEPVGSQINRLKTKTK